MAISGDMGLANGTGQDANMEDIGDNPRPPGAPPDARVSWAAKVAGSSGGGMPNPEDVIDETFIAERVQLEFPDGEDGEAVVTIGREVLEAMNGIWKKCMIVKVLGRNVPISVLNRKLCELWKPKGAIYVTDLPRHFFMIRFDEEEDYVAALTGGPWRAFGSYVMIQAWSPTFDPMRDEIETTPVWIRISNLPVNYYHKSLLMIIARGLGNPLKVDLTTLRFESARFARICIEVNLKKPLKSTIMVNGERYFVLYEGLTTICSTCGLYGHSVHQCPKVVQEKSMAAVPTEVASTSLTAEVRTGGESQPAEGFTLVRSAGKRSDSTKARIAGAVISGGENGGKNLRKSAQNKGSGILANSNRFIGLADDTQDSILMEIQPMGEANKENVNMANSEFSGKSIARDPRITFGSKSSTLDGPKKDRKMGQLKGP